MLIGVFDSGVGGLTVLRALHSRLPGHDFLYLGDTARVPYGRKPPAMVRQFSREIANFLLASKVEALVIACNTASAAALPGLADELPVPVWGVIEPGVAAARKASRGGHTGIIGTKGTIASGVYQRKLEAQGLTVWAQACPLLVHVVEEGLAGSPEAELLVRHYLNGRPELDTLILGCTHYPVLRDTIARVVGPDVQLVDSAQEIAKVVSDSLPEPAWRDGTIIHYVTGDAIAYEHTAHVIGGVDGEIRTLSIADLTRGAIPLACNLKAISPTERARYHHLVTRLRSALSLPSELSDGYEYKLKNSAITHQEVAEWITLERQCCPFLDFQFDTAGADDWTLQLRGPAGVKAILDQEFPVVA